MPAVPVYCNLLCPTRAAALKVPRADIVLGYCGTCGFIYNLAFDPTRLRYASDYENSLHFSPRFQAYAQALAARLIAQYDLHGKDIIEIGCGKGDFLKLLCDLGGNRGVGFDPSYAGARNDCQVEASLVFIPDVYSERYAAYRADFICCRHTLEHVQYPKEMLAQVQRAIGKRRNTVVYFEVPNALFTLRDLAIWDIIYEHCSYFSAPSLAHVFAACGFKVLELTQAFESQFLCIEAVPGEGFEALPQLDEVEGIRCYVAAFAANFRSKVETWKHKLEAVKTTGRRMVVWGAGSKGVTFLNTLELQDQIAYVVDINPRKQGMFVAGSGQQVVPPQFLQNYRPEIVVVMNPIYVDEIRQTLAAMKLSPEVILS
ncbi:MAG: class I SAM-dependent methyltransferase [candidate division KSB1 bacterium]|nr:class I SAM-dependent methyltransferase [candidate division KSB1 bacterium]MDZ7301672.1 class I SAM-dependent methyltransferase [candidate division KSB1 bacterium]MDZ7314304.1 class I SAM-dependent methyltransferase [candidate division KSB1 bacterium]